MPKSTSVLSRDPMFVMGVDPGFAHLGIAVLEKTEAGTPVARFVNVLESKKAGKKAFPKARVADDDQRRLRAFWDTLDLVMLEYQPVALGIEGWRPFPGQTGGNAWKVGMAAQMVQCLAWKHGVSTLQLLPSDIKRKFLGSNAGDKASVGYAILQRVEGLATLLDKYPKGKHEHIYDAAGLALLVMDTL